MLTSDTITNKVASKNIEYKHFISHKVKLKEKPMHKLLKENKLLTVQQKSKMRLLKKKEKKAKMKLQKQSKKKPKTKLLKIKMLIKLVKIKNRINKK